MFANMSENVNELYVIKKLETNCECQITCQERITCVHHYSCASDADPEGGARVL